jgi:hypothetical protein
MPDTAAPRCYGRHRVEKNFGIGADAPDGGQVFGANDSQMITPITIGSSQTTAHTE